MVTRVTGIVNGETVEFRKVVGDQWETKVPSTISGAYAVYMTAWDEAGNIAHYSKYILMYDPVNLCARIIRLPYYAEVIGSGYRSRIRISDYYAELEKSCCRG